MKLLRFDFIKIRNEVKKKELNINLEFTAYVALPLY